MGDCQLVLRFFAFRDDAHVRGSVRAILDGAMERNRALSDVQLDLLDQQFSAALDAAVEIFGDEVFTLPPDEQGIRRVSASLYDATMVALDRRRDKFEQFVANRDALRARIDQLSTGESGLMTGRANTAASIKERVQAVIDVMDEIAP